MKVKIGTQMDERLFRSLKLAAARQNRPLSTLVEEAVAEYLSRPAGKGGFDGMRRFLSRKPLRLSSESLGEILRADFYDQ